MLQSIAKGAAAAKKEEARPATQAFVTEPLAPRTIEVGDVAHRNARRAHDATLVGLAPPPPHHVSSLNTQPLALPQVQTQVQTQAQARDDRTLATILVVGTLIAMFSIAFSAVPDKEPSLPQVQTPQAALAQVAPPADAKATKVQSAAPVDKAELPLAPQAHVGPPKAAKPASRFNPHLKASAKNDSKVDGRADGKVDGKVAPRRRSKPSAN